MVGLMLRIHRSARRGFCLTPLRGRPARRRRGPRWDDIRRCMPHDSPSPLNANAIDPHEPRQPSPRGAVADRGDSSILWHSRPRLGGALCIAEGGCATFGYPSLLSWPWKIRASISLRHNLTTLCETRFLVRRHYPSRPSFRSNSGNESVISGGIRVGSPLA
jgi:hypothetical protein